MKSLTLAEVAAHLDARFEGDGSYVLNSIAALDCASPADLSFLSSKTYEKFLPETKAGAVMLSAESADKFSGNKLIVENAYIAYARASEIFDPRPRRVQGVHPTAVVSDSAKVSSTASIGANCVLGDGVVIGDHCELYPGVVLSENVTLGDNCLLYANVTLYSNVTMGDRVVIHSGTVIGSDGFGFAPTESGWLKIHQIGGVVIGNNVEIGSCTSIDRGAIGDTVIKDGVIIDNQVHLAHNVQVGENTAIAGCVGIAGSTTIGKNCTIAGSVAINGHISIADNTHFHGGTIVTKGTKEAGAFASAPPMQDVKKWRRNSVRYGQLDDIVNRVKKLEKSQKS